MKPTDLIDESLLIFLKVSDCKSFSQAADKTGLQQSGLTKIIQKLEQRHNQPLFIRSNSGVILTEFGRELKNRLQKTLDFIDSEDLQTQNDLKQIKIACHPSLAVTYLPPLVNHLQTHYPLLNLEFIFQTSKVSTRLVLQSDASLAIVINPDPFESLTLKKISREWIQLVSHPKNKNEVIFYNPDMIGSAQLLKKFKNYRLVEVNNYEVILSLTSECCGWGLLPNRISEQNRQLRIIHKFDDMDVHILGLTDFIRSSKMKPVWNAIKEIDFNPRSAL